jgi:CHAT domain-containing protein
VLATLWRVAEEASLAFMERFYQQAVTGVSLEATLREAQVAFIRGADNPRWAHPLLLGELPAHDARRLAEIPFPCARAH